MRWRTADTHILETAEETSCKAFYSNCTWAANDSYNHIKPPEWNSPWSREQKNPNTFTEIIDAFSFLIVSKSITIKINDMKCLLWCYSNTITIICHFWADLFLPFFCRAQQNLPSECDHVQHVCMFPRLLMWCRLATGLESTVRNMKRGFDWFFLISVLWNVKYHFSLSQKFIHSVFKSSPVGSFF